MPGPHSPQKEADEAQVPQHAKRRDGHFLSLEQMIVWTAGANLLIALVFAFFPSLYPSDGPFLSRLGMFVTQFTLPLYTVQLIGIWVIFFTQRS
jgi:hypothetical protein